MDDPWYWGVEKVVATLCDLRGPMLRGVDPLSIPDRAFLEKALRENAVSGPTLLTELTHPVLRDDLGLKPLGHRTTLMHVIMDLRRQSSRYLQHLETQNAISYPTGYGPVLNMGQTPRFSPSFTGAPFQQISREASVASNNLPSPFVPIVHGHLAGRSLVPTYQAPNYQLQALREHPRSSIQGSERTSPDRQALQVPAPTGNEDRPVDGGSSATVDDGVSMSSPRTHSSEGTGSPAPQNSRATPVVPKTPYSPSDIGRQGETIIIDENGKKRRRLVLAPTEPGKNIREKTPPTVEGRPVSLASRETSFLEAESGQDYQTPYDEPMERSAPSTPVEDRVQEPTQPKSIMTSPRKDNDRAGTIIIDEQGRKRVKPVLITRTEHENSAQVVEDSLLENTTGLSVQLPTPSSETSSVKPNTRLKRVRKPCHTYLGAQSLPVDQLFYSDTKIGQEVNKEIRYDEKWQLNGADNLESFAFAGNDFGNGLRCYVNSRIRHILYSRQTRKVSRRGQIMVVHILYPGRLGKKHRQLSVTVYSESSDGIIASRMDRSSWLGHEAKSREGQMFVETAPTQPTTALLETDGDTNWDYLKKWDFKAGEEKVLPVYGDSGSENEYDLDTWREMEEEEGGKIARPLGRSTRKKIDGMAAEHAISEAIERIVEHWARVKKPKLLLKAWRIWKTARKNRTASDQIGALTLHVQYLETRLSNIKREILREDWPSAKEVMKQCKSMEESIFDRETCKWRVSILKLRAAPEKPPSAMKTPKKPKPQPSQIPVEDSGEDILSKDSASENSDDDLDDFIDDEGVDEANVEYVNEDVARALEDRHVAKVSDMSDSNTDDASSESDGTESEEIKSESPAAGQKMLLEARRKKMMDALRKTRSTPNVEVIDLTQLSESSEAETRLERSSPIRTPPMDSTLDEDPSRQNHAKPAVFKRPPMSSSIIHIDSDSAEYSTAKEDISSSPSSLPEFGEVEKISDLSWEMLIERKDRKRLLIWIVYHAKQSLRDRIIDLIDKKPFQDIEEAVWVAFKALFAKDMNIAGVGERESNAWKLLATWYVSWTVPIKVNSEQGILRPHLRTAQKDHRGFLPFYEFLNKCLIYYEQKKPTKTAVLNSKEQKPEKPKRRELREGSDEHLESTPRKKRKYAVPESQEALNLRRKARERVHELNVRESIREKNLKQRFREIRANEDDSSMAVINPGKLDEQASIYINPKISSKMQAHQREGVQFMWREVVTDHQGCLLAQTMGLGKTMQVITLLVTIAEAARSPDEKVRNQVPKDLHQSRTLILCPPALVENWWEEFLIWTPSPSAVHMGQLRKVTVAIKLQDRLYEIQKWRDEGGVLLLGFNNFRDLVLNKANKFGKRVLDTDQHESVEDALLNGPSLIVADEAHCAKGLTTGINQSINRFKSMNRIALTGSPLANNLEEYHSLIDWIAPNYLGTRIEFKANYGERIQEGLYQDSTSSQYRESLKLLEVLKTELQPKVHRADITALRGKLKEKQEFVIRVPLTKLQKQIYEIYVDSMLSASREDEPHSATMWAWLSTLRLVCNHPKCFQNKLLSKESTEAEAKRRQKKENEKVHSKTNSRFDALEEVDTLVDAPVSEMGISQSMVERQLAPFNDLEVPHDTIALSNKMQILMEIIQFSREVCDKVLVFSHSIDTLNYVEERMQEINAIYSRIDGKVLPTSRQNISKEFNAGSIEVCLISTRAGGQGLNLFGANRVIILDDHFNPMYEEQAVGRAYRIGQEKAVFVYHLMAGGTFEELLHNQSVFKQQLARRVVDKKNPARYALRKIGEYLFHPKKVEQKNLGQFRGKDPRVLERILDQHDDEPIIRSMDFTETFHQEDTIALTEEEKKEAEQLQKDEQLRRSDPAAYSEMIAKRSRWTVPVTSTAPTLQAFNPALDSPGQGFPHFNPPVQPTAPESHFFSLAAITTGQQFPFLDRSAIPPLPESPFKTVSAVTSPGWPTTALPGTQSMPLDLSSIRCNSAPPSSPNDPVPKVNKQNAPLEADGNELATSTESHANRTCLSPILSASTTMIPRDTASPEKQKDPVTPNPKRQRYTSSHHFRPTTASSTTDLYSDSVAASAVEQAPLSPILGSNTSIRPPEMSDDSGAHDLRRKRSRATTPSSASGPVLNLSPYPPLQDLLSREATRMSKERPSSKT